jgi:hypothetical protein
MKRLIITEDEKKRIKLLYEQSTFVKDMAKTFNSSEESFLPLDWSTLEKTDPKRSEYGQNLSKVKTAFQNFTNKAWNGKTDISKTISYLQNYNINNKYQKRWLDSAIKTLQHLQNQIKSSDNTQSKTNTTTTNTTTNSTNVTTPSFSDWKSKLNQQFGINS